VDRRLNKYLARYGECRPSTRFVTREILRAQGRSLQALHESALAYVNSSLPEEETTEAISQLRAKYRHGTHVLRQDKKGFRRTQSFYGKYWGKKLRLTKKDGSGPEISRVLVGTMGNHLDTRIHLRLEGSRLGNSTSLYPDAEERYNIEILEDSHSS
jgi:hypothetical protein